MNVKNLVALTAVLLNSACLKTELQEPTEGREITITATREGYYPDTKTILKPDGSVEWCPLDEISIFYTTAKNGGSKFVAQNTEQTPIAEFRGRLEGLVAGGEEFTDGTYLYGVYPYSTNTTFKDGVTTITLPTNQIAKEGTFSNSLLPTIARAQGVNLAFYNICGGIKFSVSRDDITSVVFKGNNHERIAGTANVVFDESGIPLVTSENIGSKDEIIVYAPAGGTFKTDKSYYIIAYPVKLNSGFSLSFRTSGQKEGTISSNKSVEIKRSVFSDVGQADKRVSSWTDITSDAGGDEEGIYLGITGFNQQLYTFPVSVLNESTKEGFNSFINELNMKNGTLLYYSVEQAITNLQSIQLPSNLSTAAIVTFTDGLDQGSIMMNGLYSDNTEYLNALNNKIKTEKIGGQPITAYSIGIKGSDVEDVTTFRNNLAKLASSSSNATEVSSMAEVNAKFKELANQLSKSNYVQTINLTMPGVSNGTLVRFTFDNVSSAKNSSLYIEGTFNLSSRSLDNVKYVGLTSTSGTTIKGTVDGIFVTFTFEGVHTNNNVLIDSKFTDEWTYITSSSIWQINSEFDKTENSDIVTERSSAVIMLVLDCSSSLASDFPKAQTNAKDFINTLYEAIGGDSGEGGNPGGDNTIYSTTPKDLTLAIWKDGKRYYLTQEEYEKANLSGAVIEGLYVFGKSGFIISLKDASSGGMTFKAANSFFYLPDKDQGITISARFADINNALSKFGGNALSSNNSYWTSDNSGGYYSYIYGSGGRLLGDSSSSSNCKVREVFTISSERPCNPTFPTNKLMLSANDGENRLLLNSLNEVPAGYSIEGLAIEAKEIRFIMALKDASSNAMNYSSANMLYEGSLPGYWQGLLISARFADINNALSKFGGNALSSNNSYWTSDNSGGYYSYIYGSGGRLLSSSSSSTSCHVRQIIAFNW